MMLSTPEAMWPTVSILSHFCLALYLGFFFHAPHPSLDCEPYDSGDPVRLVHTVSLAPRTVPGEGERTGMEGGRREEGREDGLRLLFYQ